MSATVARIVLVVVVLLHFSGVLAAAARTMRGEEWGVLGGNGGGVIREVVEMLVGSNKSGSNGDTHCC
uniref:Uncharacterized protein n=1 Tax=Leersia perrieri TaxID=77586 RepID=A0A0D9W3R8_9ORYZ